MHYNTIHYYNTPACIQYIIIQYYITLHLQAADSNIAIRGFINFTHNVADFFDGVIQVQDFVQFQMYSGSHMYFHNNTGM